MVTSKEIKSMYYTTVKEDFPDNLAIVTGGDSSFYYELSELFAKHGDVKINKYVKKTWNINGEDHSLRYGENPHLKGAYYVPETLNSLDINFIKVGKKDPSLINIKDIVHGFNILKYFSDSMMFTSNTNPSSTKVATMKHYNPAGVADKFKESYEGDWRSALGSVVNFNTEVTMDDAKEITNSWGLGPNKRYFIEVIAAPSFEEGAKKEFQKAKNLRLAEVNNFDKLPKFKGDAPFSPQVVYNPDGSLFLQDTPLTRIKTVEDIILNLEAERNGKRITAEVPISNKTLNELKEAWWIVNFGVRSNGVGFYKDGRTVAIGTGEQERVGAVEQAIDKAYKKCLTDQNI